MRLFRENRIFVIILVISILAASIAVAQRWGVENESKTVDIMLDYEEMLLLSQQSPEDISWWLSEFAEMGINKVGLHEETLDSLTKSDKPVKAELVLDLRKDTYWMSQAPEDVIKMIDENVKDDFDVMVIAESVEMFDFVNRAFTERYDSSKTHSIRTDDGGYILIDGTVKDSLYGQTEKVFNTDKKGFRENTDQVSSVIMYLNLGLLPEKVSLIEAAGCKVEPRTLGYEGWNDNKFLEDVEKQYEDMNVIPDYWIMGSKVVPGYDDGTENLTKYLNKRNITIGIVENTTQRENISPDGMENVIRDTDYDVVRIFSVWPYIQYRYGYYGYESYEEIENTLFRAITERNIKVIYYKPMKHTDDSFSYITDIKDYRESFARLESRLADHGITIGDTAPSEPYSVPLLIRILVAIGAGCAALICLRELFPVGRKLLWVLFGIGCIGVLGAYYVAPNMATILSSFAASVFMPCVALIWMLREGAGIKEKLGREAGSVKIIVRAIPVLLVGIIIALAGAVMTAAPISSINFMLELDIFRGVKLAQLLPLAFFGVLYVLLGLYLWGEKKKTTLELRDVKWVMNYNIKAWMVFVGLVLAAAGYVYLARTGHESGMEVSSIEIMARNYLEEILYARPRTKEFLVAFPAVLLFIYSMVRELKIFGFVFGAAGVIGFTSVVNTFMHIRTPLELGFSRTAYSLVLGLVLGVIYVLIFDVLYKLCRKWGRRANAS